MKEEKIVHIPVLLNEVVAHFKKVSKPYVYVDGTLGSGGHAYALTLQNKGLTIVGFDKDTDALKRAEEKLSKNTDTLILVPKSFDTISESLKENGIEQVDTILLDLGISSVQLEDSGRGFSFKRDEPLLMTMEKNRTDLTAEDIVNTWSEESIANVLYGYGEERFARRIARAIVLSRKTSPIKTTFDLVKIVEESLPKGVRNGKIHPATKTFQALRIAANDELGTLERGIQKGWDVLKHGGRMLIITFHSLEDRIVKNMFRDLSKEGHAVLLTKKPIVPQKEESIENPRARSAKLRVIEKK